MSVHNSSPAHEPLNRKNGPFTRKIKEGRFAVSVELVPPLSISPEIVTRKGQFVRRLAASGLADALSLVERSMGLPMISPTSFVPLLRERLGWTRESGDALELIAHCTTRDRNALALQSHLVGCHLQRIRNVLCTRGDPIRRRPGYPRSRPVFDLDSIDLIHRVRKFLNAGRDFGGAPLGRQAEHKTRFTIGATFQPGLDAGTELARLRRKIDAGADYIVTQMVFDPQTLEVLEPFRGDCPVLVGTLVLEGEEHAGRVAEIPGVSIPPAVWERLRSFERPADQAKAGGEMAIDQMRWIREQGWAGVYLVSAAVYDRAIDVLRAAIC